MPAHRDEIMKCASCTSGLEPRGSRLICGVCGGALVTGVELVAMMNEMSPDDQRSLEQWLLPHSGPQRECPRCVTKMTPSSLYGVALDRCIEHGIWFDGEELAKVLEINGAEYASRQVDDRETGTSLGGLLGSTIRALFRPMIEKRRLEKHRQATMPKTNESGPQKPETD